MEATEEVALAIPEVENKRLFDREGVEFLKMGLILPDDLTFEEFEEVVGTILSIKKNIDWSLGDVLNYGQRRWGEMYAQAIHVTGKSYDTLAAAKSVAEAFPRHKRRWDLDFAYYHAVASLMSTNPDIAAEILDKAVAEDLPSKEVRWDVKQARIELGLDNPDEGQVVVPHKLDPNLQSLTSQAVTNNGYVGGESIPGTTGHTEGDFEDFTEIRYDDTSIVELVDTAQDLLSKMKEYMDALGKWQRPVISIKEHENESGVLVLTLGFEKVDVTYD